MVSDDVFENLPRCPICNRILRVKNDRPWCVTCHHWVDEPEHT